MTPPETRNPRAHPRLRAPFGEPARSIPSRLPGFRQGGPDSYILVLVACTVGIGTVFTKHYSSLSRLRSGLLCRNSHELHFETATQARRVKPLVKASSEHRQRRAQVKAFFIRRPSTTRYEEATSLSIPPTRLRHEFECASLRSRYPLVNVHGYGGSAPLTCLRQGVYWFLVTEASIDYPILGFGEGGS